MELSLDPTYKTLLQEVKEKVHQSQIKAMVKVNQTLLFLYREIGKMILERQEKGGRGAKVIDLLAQDLKKAFPVMKGFSKRNLLYMRQFASIYPDFQIVQEALAQISWYQNITLFQKVKDEKKRLWYAQKSLENGWSVSVLVHQLESQLFERTGKALTNFSHTLPKAQSDMAEETLKDPYLFDFLNLTEEAKEKEVEEALVKHIISFLLELWEGFAFVGRQYNLNIGGDDFFIDLLFYHLKLRCYVVVELKTKKFIPEYAGKLNFYLSVMDDLVKSELDNPTIGILLCKDKKWVTAEYALKDINKPIGITEYKLTESLPKEIQSQLPSIEALEKELEEIDEKDFE